MGNTRHKGETDKGCWDTDARMVIAEWFSKRKFQGDSEI